jgi:hypothetical protein
VQGRLLGREKISEGDVEEQPYENGEVNERLEGKDDNNEQSDFDEQTEGEIIGEGKSKLAGGVQRPGENKS